MGLFSKTVVNPYGTLNPEQVALNKQLGPQLQSNIDSAGAQYTGQLSAPISAGEQNVVDNSARMDAIANGTYSQIGQYDPASFNQQFDEQVANPTFDSYKRNVLPSIQEAVPGFSTARANVTARGLQNVSDTLATQRFNAQTTAKQQAMDALSGASSYNTNALKLQAAPREIQQAGLDKAYTAFLDANKNKQTAIDQALNFLGISTGTVKQDPTALGDLVAGAGAAANIYSSLAMPGATAAAKVAKA